MEVSSTNKPFPEEPTYKQDFHRSVELFEKSFKELQHSEIDQQKKMYVNVMKESLSIMHETASAMVNQHLSKMKEKLDKDLTTYLDDPSTEHKNKVLKDIEGIKSAE
ncbi:MAG: hypothetical protein FJZ57_05435 [Chlamydiae bacterium]|nr:hypothetical protein [Chlamydiota bacterium]